MKTIKKIGSILFCLLPVLLAFGIQMIVTFAAVFLKIFLEIFKNREILVDGADPANITDSILNPVMSSLMDSQFLAGISAVCSKKQPRRKISSIINPWMVGGLAIMMLGMQYISTYVVMLLAVINPGWYQTYEELMKSVGFGDVTLVLAIYSVLIAPVSEELIFRGVTMKYAVKAMPFVAANILQAFLFGLFHANVIQGTYAFVVGLFCGYVCYKGGSLYLSILFHMMFNLWGTFAPSFLNYSGNSIALHIVIFAAAVCAATAGIFLYLQGIKRRPPMEEIVADGQC